MARDVAALLVPHSPTEFKNENLLAEWLRTDLPQRPLYHVVGARRWKSASPGVVCLFHKNKYIVGEAELASGIKAYDGPEQSPATGKPYEGQVHIKPDTIKLYSPFIPWEKAAAALRNPGAGLPRGLSKLTSAQLEQLRQLTVAQDQNDLSEIRDALRIQGLHEGLERGQPNVLEIQEGASKIRSVKLRQRSEQLREQALLHFRTQNKGRLVCQVCDFDFESFYGELGRDFIEIHHKSPLHFLPPEGRKVMLNDELAHELAPLCPNCHRMIHRDGHCRAVEELRGMLRPHK